MLFPFVQFEFTHSVGPPAGCYVVDPEARPGTAPSPTERIGLTGARREAAAADVLAVSLVGAPQGQRRVLRRPRKAERPDARAVPVMLLTYIKATEPLADAQAGTSRVEGLRYSEPEEQRFVREGLEVINRAIRAYRAGARDPYVIEVTRHDPRAIRIGFGETNALREGRWSEAYEVRPPVSRQPKRAARLRPQETVGQVLSGAGRVLEGEDVLLRALVDLDQGRPRAAALQVRGALALLAAELAEGGEPVASPTRRRSIEDLLAIADRLASAALAGPLDPESVETLDRLLIDAAAVIDDWRWPLSLTPATT